MQVQDQKQETAADYSKYHMPAELVDEMIEYYGLDKDE